MGKKLFKAVVQSVQAKSAVSYTDGPGYSDHSVPTHDNYPED